MIAQKPAQIILSSKRETYHFNGYRSLSCPIGKNENLEQLQRFSEETLGPHKIEYFTLEEDCTLILMPLVGHVTYCTFGTLYSVNVGPEELQVVHLKKGQSFSIKNPDPAKLAKYLQVWVKTTAFTEKIHFGNYSPNHLNLVLQTPSFNMFFGVLDGRRKRG